MCDLEPIGAPSTFKLIVVLSLGEDVADLIICAQGMKRKKTNKKKNGFQTENNANRLCKCEGRRLEVKRTSVVNNSGPLQEDALTFAGDLHRSRQFSGGLRLVGFNAKRFCEG